MNELEDIKLKALLQEMKLESPDPDFTVRVMNKVFEENIAFEKLKSERILGKGFWVILFLFVILFILYLTMSGTGAQPESQINTILPEINSEVSTGYQSFLDKMGNIPLSIAGILAGSSLLLFIDRFISSNTKIFA